MRTAYQPVAGVVGDTLAFKTRREGGIWLLHDTYVNPPLRMGLAISGQPSYWA
jgi:hypothetical protein